MSQPSNNPSLANAIARLERAGAENSKATKKLRAAASALATWLEAQPGIPVDTEMPRGYYIHRVRSNVASALFLCRDVPDYTYDTREMCRVYIDGTGAYLHGDFHCEIPECSRAALLDFAADVAAGWLEEVAQWIEERAAKDASASSVLEQAIERQQQQ